MKRIWILSSLILVMGLMTAGCQMVPPGEIVKTGCGPYPARYQEAIKGYLKYYLNDPESLKDFSVIRPPTKITLKTDFPFIPLFDGQKVWECLIVYNAKDPSGQYVGKRLHVVWIRFNRIVAYDYTGLDLDYVLKNRTDSSRLKDKNG